MFVHTVIMVIEPHMKQGRQHKLISTIFLATSVTKKLDHNTANTFVTLVYAFVNIVKNHVATAARAVFMSFHLAANHEPIAANTFVTFV